MDKAGSSKRGIRAGLARSVGGFLSIVIERIEHKQTEVLATLQDAAARGLAQAETLAEAAAPILKLLCESLDWEVGELWLVDSKLRGPILVRRWACPSLGISELRQSRQAPAILPSLGRAEQHPDPVWIADIAANPQHVGSPEAQQVELHGMFRLPISVHGEIRAVLQVACRQVREKDDAQMTCMSSVGVLIGRYLERQGSAAQRLDAVRKADLFDGAPDALLTIDRSGIVVDFNSAASELFRYRREQALGHELLDLIVPSRMREQVLGEVTRYRASGNSPRIGQSFDAVVMRSDGSEFPAEVGLSLVPSAGGNLLVISVSDASARLQSQRIVQRSQERLRALMTELVLVEERERRRLAVDLHDGLSQTIALIKIKLSALRPGLQEPLARSLDEIVDLVEQADGSARSITFELSPPVLHDLGLEPAVEWLVENIKTRYGIEIALEVDGRPEPVDENTRVILFRSIRELLINAAKHAHARRVRVRLEHTPGHLNAAIADDGIGMNPFEAEVKGSGLFSIQERMASVGGSMQIDSAPGRGTQVQLEAPTRSQQRLAAQE